MQYGCAFLHTQQQQLYLGPQLSDSAKYNVTDYSHVFVCEVDTHADQLCSLQYCVDVCHCHAKSIACNTYNFYWMTDQNAMNHEHCET